MTKSASSHKLFRGLLQRSIVLLFLSDARALLQNGKEIIGCQSSLQNILYSLMGTPIEDNGMKVILICTLHNNIRLKVR